MKDSKKPDSLIPLLSEEADDLFHGADRPPYKREPLQDQHVRTTKHHSHGVDTFLKVLLCVSVVGGLVWTTHKLSTYYYYASPTCKVVIDQQFHQGGVAIEGDVNTMTKGTKPMCDNGDDAQRFDCHPGPGASQKVCEQRGCCWRRAQNTGTPAPNGTLGRSIDVPYCYFPSNYPSYVVQGVRPTDYGLRVDLTSARNSSLWPGNLPSLRLDVYMETETRLHFKITSATSSRYEVPIETPTVTQKAANTDYDVQIKKEPFGIVVKRKSTGTTVFDSTLAPLLYADQYLQLSTVVPSGYLYGLGEHRSALYHNTSIWQQVALWARDQPPGVNENLYGVHPFFMSLEKDGNAYGVFFLNSNAMDIDIQPYPAVTYRTVGGILDFYVLLGPSPSAVLQQYAAVVGRPTLPPYWALGFHLCRWGYGGTDGLKGVIQRMRNASFPYDVQWMDIDYMRKHLDWTYDEENYNSLPGVIQDLHDHGQHFVIIVDPGISSSQQPGQYPPYDDGLRQDVFVKDYKGNPIQGRVWPGQTVFPDFTNPRTDDWWYAAAKDFHNKIAFDGLWTDMNEPSNFVQGSTQGCSDSLLDNPPYTPGILNGQLSVKTLCPSARHHLGNHYDLHSLYGHTEARSSHRALEKLRGKRSFVITRSSFPGTGQYAGHWTGDNVATWDDLYYSIPTMLSFQLFAIPLVGADTCGFTGDTTEELCTRWMQLAAFYPFMRNHNMIHAKAQDPASFSETAQNRMRVALVTRYTLLPYLYTLLYLSHSQGGAVVNALAFVYPKDPATHSIDRQFMWGEGLLISPVLEQGQTSVSAYFPNDTWYELMTGKPISTRGEWATLNASLDTINVHVRGGAIISQQHPLIQTTTTAARANPFQFLVALDAQGEAEGLFYWDDGDTINATENGTYHLLKLQVGSGRLTASVQHAGYKPPSAMTVNTVTVLGVKSEPKTVTVNSTPTRFTWDPQTKVMVVPELSVNLLQSWNVIWTL